MFAQFKSFIESHFGVVLILAIVSGMFMPGAEVVPQIWVAFLLAGVIFFGCSKITVEDIKSISVKEILGFYVFRFCVLPFLMFYLAGFILPEFRYAFFMLALLPCGVTLPGITALLGGNGALGISATSLTSLLAPLTIPLAFSLVSDMSLQLDVLGMGRTLAMIIFLPIGFYFLVFRHWQAGKVFVRKYSSFVTVLQIGIVATIIIGSQRAYILEHLVFMLFALFVAVVVYVFLYALGWFLFRNRGYKNQVSYALMSGNMNIALGVTLAFLYFPAQEVSMLMGSYVAWLVALSGFQVFLRMRAREEAA